MDGIHEKPDLSNLQLQQVIIDLSNQNKALTNQNKAQSDEIKTITTQNENFSSIIAKQQENIEKLEHRLEQLLRVQFGRRSEKFDPCQMALFPDLFAIEENQETKSQKPPRKRDNHGRSKIPEDLPRVTKIWPGSMKGNTFAE